MMDPRGIDRATRRKIGLGAAALLLLAGLSAAYTFRNPWFRGNFGVVDDGLVYRSAQPIGDWPALISGRKIATVLDLRGGSESDPWYAAEVAASRALHFDFYDLPMAATARPTRKQLLAALDLLGRCMYPLLIHCKSGSDRTGLISGLYLMARKGLPPEQAEAAFSVYYGHVPLLGTRHLHEPFREYAAYLAAHQVPHTPDRLRDWIAHDYRADDPLVDLEPLAPGPRDRRLVHASARPDGPASR